MPNRTELVFAHWAVPSVKDLRGDRWNDLVTHVAALPPTDPDALAFALMMIQLNGCLRCDARIYRERGGCGKCARHILGNLCKESEAHLMARYEAAQERIRDHDPRGP